MSKSSCVWIIDDDRSIRWVLEKALLREDIACMTFSSGSDALRELERSTPTTVLSDIRMPGVSGLELLQALKERLPKVPVIIMTAYSDLDSAVAAFQGGAFEYLPKPFDVDQALELVRRALAENASRDVPASSDAPMPEILGQAPAMQEVFRAIGRLAQSHATVLITGESGSGKELVARALHRHSPRAGAPFIALNTAAIPRDLLESELFGHERGAFTGAAAQRRGRFEQADGGTLFLDEIGDMPAELQTRLLRVLADGQFYRVGGHTPIKVNVRVIAATHQDLEVRVREGLFREDLFHIPLLVRHFMQKSARELGMETKSVSDAAMKTLVNLPWSGNVRQLENVSHYLTVMAPGQVVEVGDLPADLMQGTVEPSGGDWLQGLAAEAGARLARGEAAILDDLTQAYEKTLIEVALRHTGGRRIEAAHLLGWGRNTLTRKIHELGMDAESESGELK
ncbi:MAG: nitrogen regulation protein NR(I) [Thiobacillus sp. SCN 62-729]|nr:MAG: nitrogen regulation protein NR(I) [Thiobacillus sp. SCN 62-729]